MRWLWITVGVVLALAAGCLFLRDYIKVKYGPQRVRVMSYRCEPAPAEAGSASYTFTVSVFGLPAPSSIAVHVSDASTPSNDGKNTILPQGGPAAQPIALHDDGVPPDECAGDTVWTGLGEINVRDRSARSVGVVLHQGKNEVLWLAPPLEHKP